MNSAYDSRLQDLTCIAYTRSHSLARREQSRALAELVTAFRSWARETRPYTHPAHAAHAATGHAGAESG